MNRRRSIVIGSLIGALAIHCGQSVLDVADSGPADGDGGFLNSSVQDAYADTGAGAPSFEKIAQGELQKGQTSKEIIVDKFREIVLYVKMSGHPDYCVNSDTEALFFPFAGAPYHTKMYPGRMPVNGPVMRIRLTDLEDCDSVQFYVMGIR